MSAFVTVYGDGAVNINTATWPVLFALGLPEELINKILQVRYGTDGQDATEDDVIFTDINYIIGVIDSIASLTTEESASLNVLVANGKVKCNARFYNFLVTATLSGATDQGVKTANCIFDAAVGRIVAWRESL